MGGLHGSEEVQREESGVVLAKRGKCGRTGGGLALGHQRGATAARWPRRCVLDQVEGKVEKEILLCVSN